MRRPVVALAIGLALGVGVTPRTAEAAPTTYCSTSALQVCAAFSASTAQVGGVWHLYLHVWNPWDGTDANGLSSVITFAGIGSSWSGTATLVSATFNGSSVAWSADASIPSNVVGAGLDFAAITDNGVNQGLVGCTQPIPPGLYQTCLPGGPGLDLDFTTSTQFVLTGAVYGWHAQAVNSTSCSVWANSNGQVTADNSANCTAVTPEPGTIMLLGTGLAGMGGFGALRRRRKAAPDA